MDRCRREIASVEAELLAGNPDVEGLVLALSDWSEELRILQKELRILQNETRRRAEAQRRESNEPGVDQAFTE
jgi:hypothetical protein